MSSDGNEISDIKWIKCIYDVDRGKRLSVEYSVFGEIEVRVFPKKKVSVIFTKILDGELYYLPIDNTTCLMFNPCLSIKWKSMVVNVEIHSTLRRISPRYNAMYVDE